MRCTSTLPFSRLGLQSRGAFGVELTFRCCAAGEFTTSAAAQTKQPPMCRGSIKAGDEIRTHDIHVGKGTLTQPIHSTGRELRSCSTTRWTHGCGKPGHAREKQSFHVQRPRNGEQRPRYRSTSTANSSRPAIRRFRQADAYSDDR